MTVAGNETVLVGGGGKFLLVSALEQEERSGYRSEESKAGVKREGI